MSATAPRLVTRQAVVLGGLAAIAIAALMTAVILDQGFDALLRSDAKAFYRVALEPFGDGSILAGAGRDTGTAYRYGRILFPLSAWALAFGQPTLLRITIPLLYIGAVMLVASLAVTHAEEAGRPPIVGLAALLVPSAFFTVPMLVPEFFVAGLILLIYRLAETHRERAAFAVAALVLLARETAVLAIVPLMSRALHNRDWRGIVRWAATVIPLLIWYVCVRLRVGAWPFDDPQVPPARALDVPVRSFLAKAWSGDGGSVLTFAAILGWATIVTGVIVAWRRRTPLSGAGLAMAALILVFGPAQAEWPGEAVRLMLPAQLLIATAAISRPAAGP